MTLVGWAQIALVLALVLACSIPLSNFIADVYAGERNFLSPVIGPVERGFYRLAGVDPAREQDWFAYTIAMLAFTVAGFLSLYGVQRLQSLLPLNPRGFDAVAAGSRIQHLDQLHHQHQLAELRRRDDDEPSDPDARPHRAQFPLRGDRPRDGLRAGARIRPLLGDHCRQLLGRSDAHHPLHSPADRCGRGARLRRSGCAADARRRGRRDDVGRRETDHRDRPNGEPGNYQGAWDQRRRLFQRQFRASVRESRTPGRTSSRSGRSC